MESTAAMCSMPPQIHFPLARPTLMVRPSNARRSVCVCEFNPEISGIGCRVRLGMLKVIGHKTAGVMFCIRGLLLLCIELL